MLTDVYEIDQKTMSLFFRQGISSGQNVLILGPSGGGKTFIAQQAAEAEGCRLIYINMSVLERPDFQGMPVISDDKKTVNYATPSFLPFLDKGKDEELEKLNKSLEYLRNNGNAELVKMTEEKITELKRQQELANVSASLISFNGKSADALVEFISKEGIEKKNDKPIVILFDEVDKAAHETCQLLLEFLQFRSVNGRPLNIKACILTANRPDEFAHTANISHAITKRCMTFSLNLDFMQWRDWAFRNGVHPDLVAFLNQHQDFLYKKAPEGDPTAYALPSPRTWVQASEGLKSLFDGELYQTLSNGSKEDRDMSNILRQGVLAGNVGESAAIKFSTWHEHYREMDKYVDALFDKGEHPSKDELNTQQIFMCALSAASKVYSMLRSKTTPRKELEKRVKNVYTWIATLDTDIKHGVIRLSFGGDFNIVRENKLAEIDEFADVFTEISEEINNIV